MERIFPPNRYDKAAYRTICFVKDEEGAGVEYYIQLNDNEDEPQWVLMGDLLVKAFKDNFNDQAFIDDCIKQYHGS